MSLRFGIFEEAEFTERSDGGGLLRRSTVGIEAALRGLIRDKEERVLVTNEPLEGKVRVDTFLRDEVETGLSIEEGGKSRGSLFSDPRSFGEVLVESRRFLRRRFM